MQISEMLHGKNIAIVGNSKSVIGKKFPVDSHDVVIRINGAWNLPNELQESVGVRLDILCISEAKKNLEYLINNIPNVIFMSPKNRNFISKKSSNSLYFYPEEWWLSLYKQLGSRPSTGCMVVDMVSRLIGTGSLTLYGFDFFQNASWHKRYSWRERFMIWLGKEIYVNPHDGPKEAEFIRNCLPKDQLRIYKIN